MDLLNNREWIEQRSVIKPGDHIYTYRAVFNYSYLGLYVCDQTCLQHVSKIVPYLIHDASR
jgi:hypothetical protein